MLHYKNLANGAYVQLANTLGPTKVQRLEGNYLTPVSSDPTQKTCNNDWLTQLTLQHFPPMYFFLIQSQLDIPSFLPPPLQNPTPSCTLPYGGGLVPLNNS